MMTLARSAVAETGSRNLCLAGGVALNSKANGKILASGLVDRVFVQPAASDDGVCLGAALAPCLDNGGKLPMRPMRHVYLGPESSHLGDRKGAANLQTACHARFRTGGRRRGNVGRTGNFLAGSKGGWNSVRALSGIVQFWQIRATLK